MLHLETYLHTLTHQQRAVVAETGHYAALQTLLNAIGADSRPRVTAIIHPRDTGAGIPDLALFDEHQPLDQPPARGIIEAKGVESDLMAIAHSPQVARYVAHYGQALVTNYYQFVLVTRHAESGAPVYEERYDLAADAASFWGAAAHPRALAKAHQTGLTEYLLRAMRRSAPLTSPSDVAWMLASYARAALQQVESIGEITALDQIRSDLETALGIQFEDEQGRHFFRSTLVQTLFYGIFSAWVLWHERAPAPGAQFDLRRDTCDFNIPVIRQLFYQLTASDRLRPLGLGPLLDYTVEALNRVDRPAFFATFAQGDAVQYFYEPFLSAFDPDLRKDLGVWYTPTEIVEYMVARVDTTLRTELGIEDGLLDPNVVILDPCCGTGAYLVAILRRIYDRALQSDGPIAAAAAARGALQSRIFGLELLPAPFVVAHLQLGLLFTRWRAPIAAGGRAQVYLTNALTDWEAGDDAPKQMMLDGLKRERDLASSVKRGRKILVVIGNPPYNAFAGTSAKEERAFLDVYKAGLQKTWGIKKFNLDDLFVRFFRLAERCIAELNQADRGIVCYVSNFSCLDDPSFVVMRQRFLSEFDRLWFDSLNGDSRETGKRIPAGLPDAGAPDPSAFSTPGNRAGIRVGTAVALMVRRGLRQAEPEVRYRDFWGSGKRGALLTSLQSADFDAGYRLAAPAPDNRYSFRPQRVTDVYRTWPKLTDLCAVPPMNGLMEKRGGALIDTDRAALEQRMKQYFDPAVSWEKLAALDTGLTKDAARFNAKDARIKAQRAGYNDNQIVRYLVRPFDTRWCYYTPIRPVWNEPRPALQAQVWNGNEFLMTRPTSAASDEGFPIFYTRILGDNDFQRGHSYYFPFRIRTEMSAPKESAAAVETTGALFSDARYSYRANLSARARDYLTRLGITDMDDNPASAALIWLHALAIGFSPAYLTEHADGIRGDYPRVPLPSSRTALEASAALGRQVADLLNTESAVRGVTSGEIRPELRTVAVLTTVEGAAEADLRVDAGWGTLTKTGVMPGRGKVVESGAALDVHLNDTTVWGGVPSAVWEYTLGGYQVLKKWLSYREAKVLGRAITAEEAREFMHIARRIAALLALSDALDAGYRA